MKPFARRLALTVALLQVPLSAIGQEAKPWENVTDGRTYTPEDFVRYSPRNALAMLEQVPGFVIREAVQERGLGQATGNVLLNGRRMSGKSNDVLGQLGRIPANNVVRIEIVDGATLDIPGLSGQVANVVTKAGGISGSWQWRPDFRKYYTDPQFTRGEVSVTGAKGAFDYTLGFKNEANHSGAGGPTDIYNADGSFREHREDEWTGENDPPKLSGQLAYRGTAGAIGNFNASYQRVFFDYVEDGTRTGPGLPDRERSVRSQERGYNYEIGGDYEFGLSKGRLKLIGLDRFTNSPIEDQVETRFADGSPTTGDRFTREGDARERIARAEYRWKKSGDWQVSGEYAFNSLDSAAALFSLDPAGVYQPVPLPGATATVEEDRYEVMGTYGRALTPKATLQVSVGGEYSKLAQVGAGGLVREFRRPKGLVSLAWKATPRLDLNMKLQRRVGQLDFYDFLASVDLNDGQANAGNPDLVPPQTWELEVEANRNLGAWGNTTLRLYSQRIDDIVDTIPIGETGESPGNIDRATLYGLEWKGTFELQPLGWSGAKINTRLQWQESRLRDPLTGETRPISNTLKDLTLVGLRHDVPNTSWAWGGELSYEFYSRDYRLTEVGRMWEGPVWDYLFVERKNLGNMTTRVAVTNLIGARSMWDRTVYVDRRTGPVDFHELRDRRIGPIFAFTFSGKF
ncbi:TonB-dependent receptor plug domain-containing protein [Lysobacter niabensis]|uniref:TonB-dependent receptor plug domain-containing protein n=1 Tax=Agrilutibacter niabensis TaxID=380628 RepID=UPI003609C92B